MVNRTRRICPKARPLRVEFPGACYHVINRGNFRFPVFEEDRDRELILEKLVDFAACFGVQIRAYCVQVNHFHCYLQTAEANLGRFMQSLLTSFSVSYNRRHGMRTTCQNGTILGTHWAPAIFPFVNTPRGLRPCL